MNLPSEPRSRRWTGIVLVITSATAFGTLAIFARLAYAAGADPITVLLLRFVIAAIVMGVLMVMTGTTFPRGKVLAALVLMGAFGYVGQSIAYFTALTAASAGLVALLLYLYPAMVTILSVVFLNDWLTGVRTLALVVALAGTVLTIGPLGNGHPFGIIMGVLAAVIYSIYIVTGSRILPHTDALAASTVIIVSAGVVFAGAVALRGPHFPRTTLGWLAIGGIAIVSTVIAVVTFFAGLARVGPVHAATLSTLEPVVTVTLAAMILGETVGTIQLVGGGFILAAVLLLARSSK